MSVGLPGESMDGSYHSEELMDVEGHPPEGHVSAIFLEEEMPAGHDDNEGYIEADEDPLALGFDVDWAVGEADEEHASQDSQEDLPFLRKYEEGPPVLHPDQLRKLDKAMDRVELNRLVKMGS